MKNISQVQPHSYTHTTLCLRVRRRVCVFVHVFAYFCSVCPPPTLREGGNLVPDWQQFGVMKKAAQSSSNFSCFHRPTHNGTHVKHARTVYQQSSRWHRCCFAMQCAPFAVTALVDSRGRKIFPVSCRHHHQLHRHTDTHTSPHPEGNIARISSSRSCTTSDHETRESTTAPHVCCFGGVDRLCGKVRSATLC